MTKITQEEVKNIAHLARIAVTETELTAHAEKLTGIFGLIQELDKYDTQNIEPLTQSIESTQALRADVVTETNHRDEFLKLAPSSAAGLFLVPQVIE